MFRLCIIYWKHIFHLLLRHRLTGLLLFVFPVYFLQYPKFLVQEKIKTCHEFFIRPQS